jgi:hypothetical protein
MRKANHIDADAGLWPRLVDALLEVERVAVMLRGYACQEAHRPDSRSVSVRAKTSAQAPGGTPPAVPETLSLGPRAPLEGRLVEVVA